MEMFSGSNGGLVLEIRRPSEYHDWHLVPVADGESNLNPGARHDQRVAGSTEQFPDNRQGHRMIGLTRLFSTPPTLAFAPPPKPVSSRPHRPASCRGLCEQPPAFLFVDASLSAGSVSALARGYAVGRKAAADLLHRAPDCLLAR